MMQVVEINSSRIDNTMAAGGLVMQRARVSWAMVLT